MVQTIFMSEAALNDSMVRLLGLLLYTWMILAH